MRTAGAAAGALAAYGLAALALSVVGPPRWSAEPTDGGTVERAVVGWAERCSRSHDANPVNCPQRSFDPVSPAATRFDWSPGDPLVLDTSVLWSSQVGAYEVRGTVNMNVEHGREVADGRTERFAGNFLAPFVALVRPANDSRGFGAYGWTDATEVDGFAIRYFGPWWEWQCCRGEGISTAEVVSP